MNTQTEIYAEIEKLIPADLWQKFADKSFAEMAEMAELAEYSDELRQAEIAWFSADE